MERFETKFNQIEVLPMVKHFIDELDLFNLFKKYVPAARGCLTHHAESLCVLPSNIICDNRPLYRVQEWLAKYSDGLVGSPVEAAILNDDRLARAPSALIHSDRHSLMTEVSCNAIRVHKLLTNVIHNDTTTVTFIGQYDTPEPEAVKLTHGHNKDFRPDCKQIVFGLNITADGHIPFIERKIRMNMARKDIEKLPISPQGMNSKKPTWNNIRYFYNPVPIPLNPTFSEADPTVLQVRRSSSYVVATRKSRQDRDFGRSSDPRE
jgi:hypothetical protein